MIVMKFGGTSVENPECVERVAGIIRDRLHLRPAVVVSAMGKTTQLLLDAARASASGDIAASTATVEQLRSRHTGHARALIDGADRTEFQLIEKYFGELRKLLEGLAILSDVPPRGLDKILSYGELLSSVIVSGALASRGVPAKLMDARQFIKTDDRYGMASPISDLTNQLTRDAINPVLESGSVPVVQGFIGSARHGATTTLGFEGSDYTAALIGAALGASDIQIWKDVSGLMTADPAIFPAAKTVKACSYQEAGELTYFGAKVLHPKAIYPAAERNIPVHIYNSKRPSAPGTSITGNGAACRNPIKSIAYKRPVSIVRLFAGNTYRTGAANTGVRQAAPDTDVHKDAGIDKMLMSALDKFAAKSASPLIVMSAGSNATIATPGDALSGDRGRYLADELNLLGHIEIEQDRAIVSVVGQNLKDHPDLASTIFSALRGIEIGMAVQGTSPIAVNLVTGHGDVECVVSRLHELFFTDLDPSVFE